MAVPLWAAMHGEVLGTGQELLIFFPQNLSVIGIALQTSDDGESHLRSEVGVFAVGLLTASPAGVTEDVDVGRPEILFGKLKDGGELQVDMRNDSLTTV